MDKKRNSIKGYAAIFRTLALIVTLTACAATIISVYLQLREANPHIDVILQSNQNLTNLPQIPQLKADFRFGERSVYDLWQSRLTLVNSGKKTIIGGGQQKNIVKDSIVLGIRKGFSLLQLQMDSADFPVAAKKVDDSHFSISFLQWRQNETINLTVFLERTDRNASAPSFKSEDRDLIDGDIVFLDTSNITSRQRKAILDRLPPALANGFRICVGAILGGIAVLSVMAFISETRSFMPLYSWRRRYFEEFRRMVAKEFPTEVDEIISDPFSARQEVWKKFSPKPKGQNALTEGKAWSYAIFVLVILLLVVSSIAGIASMIVV